MKGISFDTVKLKLKMVKKIELENNHITYFDSTVATMLAADDDLWRQHCKSLITVKC